MALIGGTTFHRRLEHQKTRLVRESAMAIFSVCSMAPVFTEVADSIVESIRMLGHRANLLAGGVNHDAINIILGANIVENWGDIPKGSIIYNLEQISSKSGFVADHYVDVLSAHFVWDYSQKNIDWMNQNLNSADIFYVPIGYSSVLTRIPKADDQDIDVLFYGAVNERRLNVLNKMLSMGLNVVCVTNSFGEERDAYIARAKVVLNMHYYDSKIFESVRVSYLLANKKAVVSECDAETDISPEWRQAIYGVPYIELAQACERLVRDRQLREHVETMGFCAFTQMSQAGMLATPIARRLFSPSNLPKKANIGSGRFFLDDCINIDISNKRSTDVVADICDRTIFFKKFSSTRFGEIFIPKKHFSMIVAHELLEHLADLPSAMKNIFDMLEDGGVVDIIVPYDLSYGAWQDPTHVRAINENTFLYFTKWSGYLGWGDNAFEIEKVDPVLSAIGHQKQQSGMALDDVVRMPRAVDSLRVVLRKRRATGA